MPDMWMDVDAAVTVPMNIAPIMETDGTTIETSMPYNETGIAVQWNFVTTAGAMTTTAITPTTSGVHDITETIADKGMFKIEIPASGGDANNDTEGFGWITGRTTGTLPFRGPVIGFRAAGLNNLLIDDAYSATRGLAGTALPAAAADAAGGLAISDAGGLDLDAKLANTNEITAARMGALTDWINGGRLDLLLDALMADVGDASGSTLGSLYAILGNAAATLSSRIPSGTPGANNGAVTTNGTKLNQTVDLTGGQSIACSDKTGFSLSSTGADLILKSSTFVQAIVAAINELATYGLTALNTLLTSTGIKTATTAAPTDMATASELAKVPKSDSNVSWNSTALGAIQTTLEANGTKLDHLWEMTEDDGGTRRLTANSLEEAPGGAAPTVEEIRTEMETAGGYLALTKTASEAVNDLTKASGGGDIAAIKAKTDKMTYTSGNNLDVNVQEINDVSLTGDGTTTPMGAA